MSTRSLYDGLVSSPKQHMRTANMIFSQKVAVEGNALFEGITQLGGIRPQVTFLINPMESKDDANYGSWSTTDATNFALADRTTPGVSNGPTMRNKSFKVTTGATAANSLGDSIYWSPSTALDLSGYKYIGFWYQPLASKAIAAGDFYFDLFGNSNTSITAGPDQYWGYSLPEVGSEATPLWRYITIDISGVSERLLKKVTRIAIRNATTCAAGATGLSFARMEAFSFRYQDSDTSPVVGGPARGLIMEAYVEPGSTAIVSADNLIWTSEGHVKQSTGGATDGIYFAGVALGAADASATYTTPVTVKFVADGVIHRQLSASIAAASANGLPCVVLHTSTTKVTDFALGTHDIWQTIGVALIYNKGVNAETIPVLIRKSGYAGYLA